MKCESCLKNEATTTAVFSGKIESHPAEGGMPGSVTITDPTVFSVCDGCAPAIPAPRAGV